MKKLVYPLIILLLGWTGLMGQGSGSVNVDIKLHPIQVLTIHPSQQSVNLNYVTPEDYMQGVRTLNEGHLGVFSTSSYEISVKVEDMGLQQLSEGLDHTPLDWLQIVPIMPEGHIDGRTGYTVTLRNDQQSLISSMRPDLGVRYDIVYEGGSRQPMSSMEPGSSKPDVISILLNYSIMTR